MQEEGQDGSVVSQPAIMMRIRARDGMGLVIKAGFTFRFFTFLPSSPPPSTSSFNWGWQWSAVGELVVCSNCLIYFLICRWMRDSIGWRPLPKFLLATLELTLMVHADWCVCVWEREICGNVNSRHVTELLLMTSVTRQPSLPPAFRERQS